MKNADDSIYIAKPDDVDNPSCQGSNTLENLPGHKHFLFNPLFHTTGPASLNVLFIRCPPSKETMKVSLSISISISISINQLYPYP